MPIFLNQSLYKLAAYTRPLVAKPVDICNSKARQSKVVPVTIDWTTFPTFAVTINLNQGTAGTTLDQMVGMYIDNSSNTSSVYLLCPDTGYQVTVPALQQRFFPLFTVTNIVNIYNGLLGNTAGNINLLFTNFLLNEFEATAFPQVITQGEVSSTVTGGSPSQNFAFQVFGDTHQDSFFSLTAAGFTSLLIAAPPLNQGLFIVKNMTLAIYNCYSATGPATLQCGICYGPMTTLITANATIVNSDDKAIPYTILYQQGDKYMALDATKVINFYNSNAIPGGSASVSLDYAWVLAV